MVDEARSVFDIDLHNSYVIGDMGASDMLLAKNIGAKGILVLTGVGKGSLHEYRYTWEDYEAYYIAENVWEAVNKIVNDIAES
jgi:histidinol phosphatase-like enzyme